MFRYMKLITKDYLILVYNSLFYQCLQSFNFQKSIVDWDVGGMTQLKNYGHLIADGELKIKSHDEHKPKPR